MKLLREYTSNETMVKNSRFLTEAFPVETPEEAREILRRCKERVDCTHVVHAFITGLEANVMGCSDDGEPAGTAGRPALEVLKGSGITNLIVCITRWFGGTKLGTGGLVKAYTECAQEVLKKAATYEWIARTAFTVHVEYSIYEPVKKLLQEYEVMELQEEFGNDVFLSGELKDAYLTPFCDRVRDMSRGRSIVQFSGNED